MRKDCKNCGGSGHLSVLHGELGDQCPHCRGLGYLTDSTDSTDTNTTPDTTPNATPDTTPNTTPNTRTTIQDAMVRAFFASAWADAVEDAGDSFPPGSDIMDLLPKEADPASIEAGGTLLAAMENQFGKPIADLLWDAQGEAEANGYDLTPETFGHYAAMEAMGHGVGLFDYGVKWDIPYVGFGEYSLEKDYRYEA
jgi:hypothetical protein